MHHVSSITPRAARYISHSFQYIAPERPDLGPLELSHGTRSLLTDGSGGVEMALFFVKETA